MTNSQHSPTAGQSGRIRVFIACSLDGFIAGPNDELDWLHAGDPGVEDTFTPFLKQVGAMLMGRRTYDVVSGFEGPWPYGNLPVLVSTHRDLTALRPSVRAVAGPIGHVVQEAQRAAGGRDVYIDGGALIRSALDADLIDHMTVTLIPIVLGAGLPLFAGTHRQHRLTLLGSRPIGGGLLQVEYAAKP